MLYSWACDNKSSGLFTVLRKAQQVFGAAFYAIQRGKITLYSTSIYAIAAHLENKPHKFFIVAD